MAPSASSRRSNLRSSAAAVSAHYPCVIIELGSAFIRCGFAGEPTPRHEIPYGNNTNTPTTIRTGQSNTHHTALFYGTKIDVDLNSKRQRSQCEYEVIFEPLLEHILIDLLLCKPRNRRVVVVEHLVSPTNLRMALAKVLLQSLQVSSLLFVPFTVAIYTLPGSSGNACMLLDIGVNEARCIAVHGGNPIMNTFRCAPSGYADFVREFQKNQNDVALTRWEDLVFAFHHVVHSGTTSDRVLCMLPSTGRVEQIDVKAVRFACGSLIGDDANDMFHVNTDSLIHTLLDALLACPIDLRKHVAQNVLVMGGGAMLPGICARVEAGTVEQASKISKFKSLIACTKNGGLKVVKLPFRRDLLGWIGASVFATLDVLEGERWMTCNEDMDDQQTIPDTSYDWLNIKNSPLH